jgi:hypothetical protein
MLSVNDMEDATMVVSDLESLLALGPEAGERPCLVALYQRGVARHIGGKDGGELAVHASLTSD